MTNKAITPHAAAASASRPWDGRAAISVVLPLMKETKRPPKRTKATASTKPAKLVRATASTSHPSSSPACAASSLTPPPTGPALGMGVALI